MPPIPRNRRPSVNGDCRTERLAINLFDVTRIDPYIVGELLGGKLDRVCPPVVVDPARGDEQCVPFTCPLVDAGSILDTLRNHDRRVKVYPTRAYLQKVKGGAWYKLAAVTVLTVVEDGEVVLNPLLFPPGPSPVSGPASPAAVVGGGRKSNKRPG